MNQNDIVVGLGFGDEGKGTIVDHLVSTHDTNAVVRFSGGAQAAHNVVLEDGTQHTFAQFGSGALRGVKTLLTEHMMVDPFSMAVEADALWIKTGFDAFTNAFISSNALLTTPIHAAANQQREINRGAGAHGSCGLGIGETKAYSLRHPVTALRVNDLRIPGYLEAKMGLLRKTLEAELGEFDLPSNTEIMGGYEALRADRPFNIVPEAFIYNELRQGYNVFEGSQGVLLDEDRGFHPHTTWSNTTQKYAQRVLASAGLPAGNVIGVTRSYTTRHGFGPFPSEFTGDEWRTDYPEHHNAYGQFQGSWRGGALDLVLLNYAVWANGGVDEVAVTHLDVPYNNAIVSYNNVGVVKLRGTEIKNLAHQESLTNFLLNPDLIKDSMVVESEQILLNLIELTTEAKVSIKSYGPRDVDKINI